MMLLSIFINFRIDKSLIKEIDSCKCRQKFLVLRHLKFPTSFIVVGSQENQQEENICCSQWVKSQGGEDFRLREDKSERRLDKFKGLGKQVGFFIQSNDHKNRE